MTPFGLANYWYATKDFILDLMLTVYHIEDDPLWCDTVRKIAAGLPFVLYAGHSRMLKSGLNQAIALNSDLILLDLRLEDADSFETLVCLHKMVDGLPRVLLVTAVLNEAVLYSMRIESVCGFIWKNTAIVEYLTEAFQAVHDGKRFFPEDIKQMEATFRAAQSSFFRVLSDREIELLPMLGEGLSNDDIAARFMLSAPTVRKHRENVMRKLDVHSTHAMMRWIAERGFIAYDKPRPQTM